MSSGNAGVNIVVPCMKAVLRGANTVNYSLGNDGTGLLKGILSVRGGCKVVKCS